MRARRPRHLRTLREALCVTRMPAVVRALVAGLLLAAPACARATHVTASSEAIVVTGVTQRAARGRADFSGVDAFWRLVARLERDVDPDSAAWDSLFAMPGYATAAQANGRHFLVTTLRVAFMPSRRAERDSLLRTGRGEAARAVRHLVSLPGRRAQIDAFRARWERENYLSRALKRAQAFLPPGTTDRYPLPGVAFIHLVPDAYGDTALIVADLAHVMVKGDPARLLAHELTHAYRTHLYWKRVAREGRAPRSPGLAALDLLLGRLENESVADQNDKAPFLDVDDATLAREEPDSAARAYLAQYRAHFRSAADQFRTMNRVLEAFANSADTTSVMKARVDSLTRALPLFGRPLGAYMARAIRKELGVGALAAVVGDPVGYALAYQEAASRPSCGCPTFSEGALRVIARLRPGTRAAPRNPGERPGRAG
jgi:hypothetical protein